jgi:hypothetical protein
MKALTDETDVIFGGSERHVRQTEMMAIRSAVHSGANAFDCSKMARKIVQSVSARSRLVGSRSVSIVIPANGMVDTNIYGRSGDQVFGYVPRMIMLNGAIMGPSEFPVELSLAAAGHLHRHSLFFKTLIDDSHKKRLRRLTFRRRKGLLVPGLLGLISLALFGSVPPGYDDFGLNSSET